MYAFSCLAEYEFCSQEPCLITAMHHLAQVLYDSFSDLAQLLADLLDFALIHSACFGLSSGCLSWHL